MVLFIMIYRFTVVQTFENVDENLKRESSVCNSTFPWYCFPLVLFNTERLSKLNWSNSSPPFHFITLRLINARPDGFEKHLE